MQTKGQQFRVYHAGQFGDAVRHFRVQAEMTQSELAEHVGIHRSYLAELEAGKLTEQTRRLVALFKVLGVRIVIGHADW